MIIQFQGRFESIVAVHENKQPFQYLLSFNDNSFIPSYHSHSVFTDRCFVFPARYTLLTGLTVVLNTIHNGNPCPLTVSLMRSEPNSNFFIKSEYVPSVIIPSTGVAQTVTLIGAKPSIPVTFSPGDSITVLVSGVDPFVLGSAREKEKDLGSITVSFAVTAVPR